MSYDDLHSGERGTDVSGACRFHCPPARSSRTPLAVPIAAGATFGAFTATELVLIIHGYGWWLLPVAMFVAMFCTMFAALSWQMGRDIMRINATAMAPRKMLCEDCPHPTRRPRPVTLVPPGYGIVPTGITPTSTGVPPDLDD
jgi:hypothetical protein